jgi:hypothetical protein
LRCTARIPPLANPQIAFVPKSYSSSNSFLSPLPLERILNCFRRRRRLGVREGEGVEVDRIEGLKPLVWPLTSMNR